jgi:hypothetical protein
MEEEEQYTEEQRQEKVADEICKLKYGVNYDELYKAFKRPYKLITNEDLE